MKLLGLMLCFASLVLLYDPPQGFAQEEPKETSVDYYWMNIGVGASNAYDSTASFAISASAQKKHHILSIRWVSSSKISIYESAKKKVWDLGILYGGILRGKNGFISLSGGIGGVGGTRGDEFVESTGERQDDTFTTAGFPIELQLFWTPSSNFGIGLYGFSNINKEETFTGVALALQIGSWILLGFH